MYTSKNRADIVNQNIVVSSIDRLKVSRQLQYSDKDKSSNKTVPRNPINENYRLIKGVKSGRDLEIGLYYQYLNKDKDKELLPLVGTVRKGTSDHAIIEKYKTIKPPARKMKEKGTTYYYQRRKPIQHKEWLLSGNNKNFLILKNKNYVTIELNDILQKDIENSIYFHLRQTVQYLLFKKVFWYNTKSKKIANVSRKADAVIKHMTISEIELAFDITYEYGHQFYEILESKLDDKESKLFKYKNTIYMNNSYDVTFEGKKGNKRSKWKVYNRSLKDRFDNGDTSDEHLPGDVYRFEITIGRKRLKHLNWSDLKKPQSSLIQALEQSCHAAFSKFVRQFDYKLMKQFIADIKSNGEHPEVPKTTQKNYIKVLKTLMLSRSIYEVC